MQTPLYHSQPPDSQGTVVRVTAAQAGWKLIEFAVRRLAPASTWSDQTGDREFCLVLLSGECSVRWDDSPVFRLGPRPNVFSAYPWAVYLPPETTFEISAARTSELAQAAVPCRRPFPARVVWPHDCGFEIRGGGNATRQIVDIMPPEFPADRLLACEVFTPGGNWSSYPPHKHDTEDPPHEVKLEEIYYYRFPHPKGYGFQRVYSSNGGDDDLTMKVEDGDLVLMKRGYHPFVTAYGYDAYYLNFLAGEHRSMAASDDPAYAHWRDRWPAPDPRLPLLQKPRPPG